MSFRNNIKKSAFTLAEIVIALFIVAILALVTLPVINRQLEKTDEYAYYMAFKSVEKMASQIVIMGEKYEESESTSARPAANRLAKHHAKDSLAARVKGFFNDITKRIAFSENSLMRKLFPKVFAEDEYVPFKTETSLFTTDDFIQQLWLPYKVCNGGTVVKTSVPEKDELGNIIKYHQTFYEESDFNNCYGYTKACAENANCGEVTENDVNGAPLKDGDGNIIKHKIEGPIAKDEVFKGMLPPEDSLNTSVSSLLTYIGYTNSNPNSGADLCNNGIKRYLKANSTDSVTSDKYENVVEFKSDEEESDDDDGEPDDKEDSGAGFDSSKFVDYTSVSNRGACILYQTIWRKIGNGSSSADVKVERPVFDDSFCKPAKGFYTGSPTGTYKDDGWVNGDTTHDTLNCVPNSGSGYEISENNPKVVCKITDNSKLYYSVKSSTNNSFKCVACSNDFSESFGDCCPKNSVASGEGCSCIIGWARPDGAAQSAGCTIRTDCPIGYSLDKEHNICVLNPPIIRANRFSQLIAENWNIKHDYSSEIVYTDVPNLKGAKYYKEVYEAALGRSTDTSKRLMSIDSKPGAFAFNPKTGTGLKPNIILANGLHLWIMSDRLASIPGLTYSTDNSSTDPRNICKNLNKNTQAACKSASTDAYFCGSENACFALDSKSIKDGTTGGMGDARNCCAAPDLSDIAAAMNASGDKANYENDVRVYAISGFTVFVDINGSKGNGTLWEDVFPFYIASNGTVYPGYPLDGIKAEDTTHSNLFLGGNSAKQLPVDIYYTESTGDTRKKRVVMSNVSYARAICTMRKISKNSPYCKNLGEKFYTKASYKDSSNVEHEVELKGTKYLGNDSTTSATNKSINPCDYEPCVMTVRRRLRSF